MTQCVIKTEMRDIVLHANTLECLDNETLFAWCEDSTDPLVRVLVKRLHKMHQYMDDEIADHESEQLNELQEKFDSVKEMLQVSLASLIEVRTGLDDFEHDVHTQMDELERVKNELETVISDIDNAEELE